MKHINYLKRLLLPLALVLTATVVATAQPLNGTYTVYGTSPDYTSLSAAISDLNSKGVSGPVNIKVRPGTYTMTGLTINNITGASATNTITIESESGTNANTEIRNTNSSSSSSSNFIFRLSGAKYVTIQNLSLNKTHSSSGVCVRFEGSAQYNTIESCRLYGSTSSSTSTNKSRVYATSLSNGHHNTINNCKIERGSYGIYWRGSSSSSSGNSDDNTFSNNEFDQCYRYGIYTYYTNNTKVLDNEINTTLSSSFYAIYMGYADNATEVKGNSGSLTGKTSSTYAIYMNYCDGTSTTNVMVEDNEFTMTSSGNIYPVYNNRCNYLTYKGNEINATGTGSSGDAYLYYSYYGGNNKVLDNEITSTSKDYVYHYVAYYSPNCEIKNNEFDISHTVSGDYVYFYNYLAYQSANVVAEDNEFNFLYSGYYYLYNYLLYYSDNSKFNNNEMNIEKMYNNGYYVYTYGAYYSDNAQLNNNKMTGVGTQNYYFYNYWLYYADDCEFKNNELDFEQNRNSASAGIYNRIYYSNDYVFTGNKIKSYTLRGYNYGLYAYHNNHKNGIIANNEIIATSNNGYVYGMYAYRPDAAEIYNNSVYVNTSSSSYGFMFYYGNNTNVYNNTIHSDATGSTNYLGYIYCSSSSYTGSKFYNNSFTKTSSNGYGLYLYSTDYIADMDYNNVYKPGSNLFYRVLGGASGTIQAWRNSTGFGMNSLSYMPEFQGSYTGDLHPDAADPDSWALNGRGVQIAGNNMGLDGNARAVTKVQGVPDLGAYEFTPTSTPPNCTAVPATPTAGATQTFLFGQDTVATIDWASGSTLPSGTIAMKQYTGTNPPGITSINPTQMFYYVDAGLGNGTYDFDMNLYYKDPATGTIASESALRLAEKVGTSAWSAYSPGVSSSNTTRNFINTPNMTESGLWTGVDVSDNASADAIIDPAPPFCPGTYTVKLRVKNNGNNKINGVKISWELNGVAQSTITHSSTIDINGSTAGNEAIITLGTVTFGKNPVNIKAWTHEPNGVTDPVPADDTLDIDLRAALAGNYTVGGTTPDYTTLTDVVSDLNTYGICGDVVFDIRPGTYTGQLEVSKIDGTGPNADITFQAENGIASSVTVTANTTSGKPYVWLLDGAEYINIKNLTTARTSSTYARLIEFRNEASHDSVVGCVLNGPVTTSSSNYMSGIYAYQQGGADIVIQNNDINNGGAAIYWYGSSAAYTDGLTIENNNMIGFRYYGVYAYYGAKDFQYNNNVIELGGSTGYGLYIYASNIPDGDYSISGNKITGPYYYPIYCYYVDGTANTHFEVKNNAVAVNNPTGNSYNGILCSYSKYLDFMNNSISFNTSYQYASALYMYYSSTTYRNLVIRNNVVADWRTGSAQYGAFYLYTSSSAQHSSDYNNVYAPSSNVAPYYYNGSKKNTLAAMRSSNWHEDHSLSYDPGFTSVTDLMPDASNPNSWSLNGRALQISGNDVDINGNARIDQRANGVPDIGAYEFDPSVAPPLATATPASAVPGQTQTFEFGGNQVAEVDWSNNLYTSPIEVRQYSGDLGVGITSQSPNSYMYFHTDITPTGAGSTYSYNVDVDYMDIWLGTIGTEGDLKLAQRFNGSPWVVYNGNGSSVNTGNDILSAPSMITFGSFTGVENGEIFSAYVKSLGKTVFCFGDSTELSAEYGSSTPADGYQWYLNNNMIAGATNQTYKVTQPGDYTVVITVGSRSAESIPVTITAVAPPMALVNANGPLTYCTGSNLVLSTGQNPGLTYQWKLNGTDINGATNFSYSVQQSGNYEVEVTNIGCSSTSSITAIGSGPLNVDLGSDTSFCEVKNVPLVLDAGYPGAKYTWSTGDTTQTINPSQSGDYVVTVDGGPNCIATDTISVNIDPLPSAKGISFVKTGNSYTFSPSGAQNVTSYLWIFSDGATSTSQVVTRQVNDPSLHVRLVMFNACGADTLQIGFPVSVGQVSEDVLISLYPNPAKDQVTISISGSVNLSEVSVINSVGQVMYRTEEVNTDELRVDVRGYANGHYMLRATTEDGRVLSKPFNVVR